MVTAHNHSCDRGKKGILRTLQVLDKLKILHTGTFSSAADRARNNLLLLEKNNIKAGLLNYTYATNGCPIPSPSIVNLIDKKQIIADIIASKANKLDHLIVFYIGEESMHPIQVSTKRS